MLEAATLSVVTAVRCLRLVPYPTQIDGRHRHPPASSAHAIPPLVARLSGLVVGAFSSVTRPLRYKAVQSVPSGQYFLPSPLLTNLHLSWSPRLRLLGPSPQLQLSQQLP